MNCRGIAMLLSERQDHGLPLPRRLAIRVHLALCVFCRRLERQFEVIRQVSRMIGGAGVVSPLEGRELSKETLSADAKSRMKRTVARGTP